MTKPDDEYAIRRKVRLERLAELAKLAAKPSTPPSGKTKGTSIMPPQDALGNGQETDGRKHSIPIADALAKYEAGKAYSEKYQKEHAAEFEAQKANEDAARAKLAALPEREKQHVMRIAEYEALKSRAPEPLSRIRSSGPLARPSTNRIVHVESGLQNNANEKANDATPTGDNRGLSKREKQMRAIEGAADKLSYKRLSIPDGAKKKIMAKCMADHTDLFGGGGDPFKEAWQAAVSAKPPRIRMKNHDRYSKGK